MILPKTVAMYYFFSVVIRSFLCMFALCLVSEKGIVHDCARKFFILTDIIAVPTFVILSFIRNTDTGVLKSCKDSVKTMEIVNHWKNVNFFLVAIYGCFVCLFVCCAAMGYCLHMKPNAYVAPET